MRYFVRLSFLGSAYHGWQRQANASSVQAELEKALTTLLRRPVLTVGAGRTDAGVHASMMVAHFDSPSPLDTSSLTYKLNILLPPDIAVGSVVPVVPDAHARFSALSRSYSYHICLRKDPFKRLTALQINYPLDFSLMQQAAALLPSVTDFASFCKTHSGNRTTLCCVHSSAWHRLDQSNWLFEITADRFLRNMVRALVGTMIDVGRERLSLDGFRRIIAARSRSLAGESVAPEGLFLTHIAYPDNIFLPAAPTPPET